MRLLLLTAIILGFHSLSQANGLVASVIAKQEGELVLLSEGESNWGLNQVPFNTLKNLRIKGTFLADQNAILVFDIKETATPNEASGLTETHVMTAQQKLIAAEIVTPLNAIRVEVSSEGDLITVTSDSGKASLVGKFAPMNAKAVGQPLYLTASGEVITEKRVVLGRAQTEAGSVVSLVTDLDNKIATLTGSGSEIVITGEKKEFLSSIQELETLNAQQKQNPEWVPVTDLKISNLGSVVQIEFRNSTQDESFSLFKLVSPLVVNQIKENQAQN